jgi:DNA-binding response OmpR family regulator
MTWPQYKRRVCEVDGVEFKLTPAEAEILLVFLVNRGRWVKDEQLIEHRWPDADFEPEWGASSTWVIKYRLKNKLPEGVFECQYGWGWKLRLPVEEESVELKLAA